METNLDWASEARPIFQRRFRKYGDAKFEDGSYILFLGNVQPARRQRTLLEQLETDARSEQPQKILDSCVKIIRAAAAESNGTIGFKCDGVRISRNDPGIEEYGVPMEIRMSNTVVSTSRVSYSVTDMRGQ